MTDTATYSPEDNKLRLYVGRVPRDQYERLRREGWTSTPKQDCDFVAVWTPQRRDTALEYADIIEDEDQGPEDRAADRAERFGEYRDKRTDEATGHADRYDSGPSAHGYQDARRAERSARRHDRSAGYACDAWSKAEYWQRRTAGVISHALHLSEPGVRMGRIKTLEAELRGMIERWKQSGSEPTGHAADWKTHLELRLAYENQMLEAQGGRAAFVEMEVGGFIYGKQIHKVNKSNATGRVVSVHVKGPRVEGWCYKAANVRGTDYALHQIDTERLPAGAYRPPTDEERAAFLVEKKAAKAAAPKVETIPLINPTDADAERLQAIWNEREKAKHDAKNVYKSESAREMHEKEFEPAKVIRITQARYSACSKGAYSSAETRGLCRNAMLRRRESDMWTQEGTDYDKKCGRPVCMIRRASGGKSCGWPFNSVIVLTDKPQKPLPAEVWSLPADLAPRKQAELAI